MRTAALRARRKPLNIKKVVEVSEEHKLTDSNE